MARTVEPARTMQLRDKLVPAAAPEPAGQYLQLCLCYPAAGKSCSFVIHQLERGLAKLVELLPWTAGPDGAVPIVIKMSCRPTYGEVTDSCFPFRWLGEEAISPLPPPAAEPLLVQINFMPDGLGLVFCAHESVMDIARMGLVLGLLHGLCVGADVSAAELAVASVGRSLVELPRTRVADPPADSGPLGQWFYFSLNTQDLAPTEDIVAALVFRAVVSAKQRAYDWSPSRPVVLARIASPSVVGSLSVEPRDTAAFAASTVDEVLGMPVADLATRLAERGTPLPNAGASDLVLRSWLQLDAYDWSFGLGQPTAVRVPSSAPQPGMGYILPQRKDEQPIVGLCLHSREVDVLCADPFFSERARFIG